MRCSPRRRKGAKRWPATRTKAAEKIGLAAATGSGGLRAGEGCARGRRGGGDAVGVVGVARESTTAAGGEEKAAARYGSWWRRRSRRGPARRRRAPGRRWRGDADGGGDEDAAVVSAPESKEEALVAGGEDLRNPAKRERGRRSGWRLRDRCEDGLPVLPFIGAEGHRGGEATWEVVRAGGCGGCGARANRRAGREGNVEEWRRLRARGRAQPRGRRGAVGGCGWRARRGR